MDNSRFIDGNQVMTALGDCVHHLSDDSKDPFQKAVDVVTERVNHNYGSMFNSVSRQDVLKVLTKYVRRFENDPNALVYSYYFVSTVPKVEYAAISVNVAKWAGVSVDWTQKILKQLEYADKDGSISKGFLDPKEKPKPKTNTNKKTTPNTNPDPIKGLPDDYGAGKDPEGESIDYVKWGALGLTGGLLLLYLVKRKK